MGRSNSPRDDGFKPRGSAIHDGGTMKGKDAAAAAGNSGGGGLGGCLISMVTSVATAASMITYAIRFSRRGP